METEVHKPDIDVNKYAKEYNEKRFWDKIKKFAFKIGKKPLYIAFLLCYSISKVSFIDKAIIFGSLGYLICPIDLIPDTIPVVGITDDIAVLRFAYYKVKKNIDDEVRNKAKKALNFYFGKFDENEIKEL